MHSSEHGNDDVEGTTFHHNGDYSGDVIIERGSVSAKPVLHHKSHTATYKVPYSHMEELVLDKLRNETIVRLEQASYDDLRKLFFNT